MLEDFNLEVEVGENVAIVYVIPDTSKPRLLITILAGIAGGVGAENHLFIPYC